MPWPGSRRQERLKAEDRWILSRLQTVVAALTDAITGYRFNEAAHTIYDFTWHEFCDWYIEAKKADIYQAGDAQRKNDASALAAHVLASVLKLLHPFMPFITSEIWSHLREKVVFPRTIDAESIMHASYPRADAAYSDEPLERKFEVLLETITALRTIRSENNVPPDRTGRAVIIPESKDDAAWLTTQKHLINQFVRLSETAIDCAAQKPAFAGSAVVRGARLYLLLEGLIDKKVEVERLTKEIAKLSALIENSKKKLEGGAFAAKAPPEVVTKEREKLEGLVLNKNKLESNLAGLSTLKK